MDIHTGTLLYIDIKVLLSSPTLGLLFLPISVTFDCITL